MKKNIQNMYHSLGATICAGTLLLTGLSVSAQNMFVGSYGNHDVEEFPSGSSTPSSFAPVNFANDIAFDASGDMFVADQFNGIIDEYANHGGTLSPTATTFASGVTDVKALAFDTSGNLFAASDITDDIYKFTPGGSESTFATGLNAPQALAFNNAGILFVGNVGNNSAGAGSITKITAGGTQSLFLSGLTNPDGLAFNAVGNLFVSEPNVTESGSVIEITPGGNQSLVGTGFNQPAGLAFDGSGDLFVADQGLNSENGDITEIMANGTRSVFSTDVPKPLSIAFEGLALPVPEPSIWALMMTGAAGLFLYRLRFNKSKAQA
jgi:hypothetical protein